MGSRATRVADAGSSIRWGRLSPASGTVSGWDAARKERPVSARKKEVECSCRDYRLAPRDDGFMEVTHTTGHGGGPRRRPSSSHR
jgi:hypothetical protein